MGTRVLPSAAEGDNQKLYYASLAERRPCDTEFITLEIDDGVKRGFWVRA